MSETKTDNELIAEFMGREIASVTANYNEDITVYLIPKKGRGRQEEAKFSTSWDWLMPVVTKIESIVVTRNEVGNLLSGWTHWFNQFNGTVDTDIKITNDMVVEFIKWYNQQTPPNGN